MITVNVAHNVSQPQHLDPGRPQNSIRRHSFDVRIEVNEVITDPGTEDEDHTYSLKYVGAYQEGGGRNPVPIDREPENYEMSGEQFAILLKDENEYALAQLVLRMETS